MTISSQFAQAGQWLRAHPLIVAALAGLLVAEGFAPQYRLILLPLIGFVALMHLLLHASGARQAFLIGWVFGLTQFVLGLNWIATAFTYQAEMPVWLGYIAVVLLSIYLAVYPALAALGAWWIGRGRPLAFALGFAGLWTLTEWVRGWLFTGFPWNPLSSLVIDHGILPHAMRWIGTYGLSGLLLIVPGFCLCALHGRRGDHAVGGKGGWALGAASLAMVASMFVPKQLGTPVAAVDQPTIAIVQPNIGQDIANDPTRYEEFFARLARLSQPAPGQAPFDMVFWPEGAIPDYLEDGYPRRFYQATTYGASARLARNRIADVARGGLLITGAQDLELDGDRLAGARNIVTAIGPGGRRRGTYAKAHLVPYGEYLPMRGLLEPIGLSRLVAGDIDFDAGPGPRSLALPGMPKMGVQICYEIVFSGHVVDRANRPDFLFNPSNDGWFGVWGPAQHLRQARMRAIEEGLPLIRSTTTGISALVDADGRVLDRLDSGIAARIAATLPPPLPPTLFARFGNWLAVLFGALLIAGGIASRRRRR